MRGVQSGPGPQPEANWAYEQKPCYQAPFLNFDIEIALREEELDEESFRGAKLARMIFKKKKL